MFPMLQGAGGDVGEYFSRLTEWCLEVQLISNSQEQLAVKEGI